MDTFSIGLRDLGLATGLLATWITWYLRAKKKAADEATEKTNTWRDIQTLESRLNTVEKRLDAHSERDDAILRAVNEIRVSIARLEAKIDKNGH